VQTSDFAYDLPPGRIAQTPTEPRDASRLMVVHRECGRLEHRTFRDIAEYLRPGDLLVLNQTRVIPARLFGYKAGTGGRVELLLLTPHDPQIQEAMGTPSPSSASPTPGDSQTWEALVRGRGLRPGTTILFFHGPGENRTKREHAIRKPRATAEILAATSSGGRIVRFDQPVEALLNDLGQVPLPPYIHQPLADPERYQTVYGQVEGSVAASTAGLHFTPELLFELRRLGVDLTFITLHIGLDTFRPVKEERVEDHSIHTEWFEVTALAAEQINRARLEGRRVVAVGTTVVRALESAAASCAPGGVACGWQTVSAYAGPTDLFIVPGYQFRVVQAMITNFHLPRSTLLMLVSAFAGRELILHAYQEAIRHEYRFFSFGDAMLLL
jgi:S-adenosylmethionine:tRNA ribosyltransferase-isomerase